MSFPKLSLLVIAALALAGCASSSDRMSDIGNTPRYRITCADNPFSHIQDCYDRAADECQYRGYDKVHEGEIGRGEMQSMWTITTHELVVQCH